MHNLASSASPPTADQTVSSKTVPQLGLASRLRPRILVLSFVLLAGIGIAVAFCFRQGDPNPDSALSAEETTLVKSGIIDPYARTNLYAKVSGYVKRVAREPRAELLPASLIQPAAGTWLVLHTGRRLELGSVVHAGQVLVEIDVPERFQELEEKKAGLRIRELEIVEGKTAVQTAEMALWIVYSQFDEIVAEARERGAFLTAAQADLDLQLELVRRNVKAKETLPPLELKVAAAHFAVDTIQVKRQVVMAEMFTLGSKLDTAQANFRVKEARVREARKEVDEARTMAEYALVCAPYDGIISKCEDVNPGRFVQNGRAYMARPLMTIINLNQVKVVFHVTPKEAVSVKEGTKVRVRVKEGISWRGKGVVSRTSQVFNPETGKMRVEIDLDNSNHLLKPGMHAEVALSLNGRP
jgi:multidrug resistance efflux pump